MKLLVFSDSHHKLKLMEDVIIRLKDISTILFLGDNYDDIKIIQQKYPDKVFTGIAGNCDYGCGVESEREVHMCGKKIWLTHGHLQSVKGGYLRLSLAAAKREADVCLFGHTHIPELFYERNILFMNPGSISEPRGKYRESYGILTIDEDGVRGSVVEITPSGLRPIS